MKTYNPLNCGGGEVGPEEFGSLVDLMLTSATALPMTETYPIEFGNPPRIYLDVENEFGVLIDWRGRVLTQGFTEEGETE